MEKRSISFELEVYPDEGGLSPEDRELLQRARQARDAAYAPYSGFQVGAAVRMDTGHIHQGNNQENASFPSGLCAERVAAFHAAALYPGVGMKAIAISASGRTRPLKVPAAPCGNCRQSLLEYEQRQGYPIRLVLQGHGGTVYVCPSVAALLPLGFDGSFLS